MARQLKTLIRSELEKKFKDVDGGIVVGYRGLDSEKIYDLRKKLHDKGVKFTIVKNSLAIRAFQTLKYEKSYPGHKDPQDPRTGLSKTQKRETKLAKLFDGPVGIIYASKGAGVVSAVKALDEWKKTSKDKFVEVRGGFLEGQLIDKNGVKALADMPSREVLLGMVAGAFQAPMAALANRLNECVAKFAYAVNALKEKREKEGGAGAPAAAK